MEVPAEGQGVPHQAVQSADPFLHLAGEFQRSRLIGQILHQHPGEQRQAAQGVPNLVGQLRRHAAHGGQAIFAGGLLGAEHGLGDIPKRDDGATVGRGAALLLEDQLAAF